MRTFSLKISDSLLRRLETVARARDKSKSQLVREALDSYLDGERPASKGSILDVAGDLIGCVEGPGDLSTNEAYFEDFGK